MGNVERRFGARSTTADVLSGIDLTGRVAVVTGATGGLGEETARSLASAGARVILAGRNAERGNSVVESIARATGRSDAELIEIDLADLGSVRSCARRLGDRVDRIDILVNNGAIMACPLARSVDGHELQLATNHLSHFLLTIATLPLLRRAANPRVVCVSSGAHWMGGVDLEDIDFHHRAYDPWAAYGQSKTANALFALELHRRAGGQGLLAYSLHPGAINTELGRHVEPSNSVPVPSEFMKTIPEGAATQVWAATAPELVEHGGRYLEDCALGQPRLEPDRSTTALGVAPHARDAETAVRLWDLSCEMVGIDPDLSEAQG
jgi:NAD(P)-dependent dehydrogenase (short-subunit alcohol dehydrogenase family)